MCKTPHKRTAKHESNKIQADTHIKTNTEQHAKDDPAHKDVTDTSSGVAGQHFHMDFEFVRGSITVYSKEINRTDTTCISS